MDERKLAMSKLGYTAAETAALLQAMSDDDSDVNLGSDVESDCEKDEIEEENEEDDILSWTEEQDTASDDREIWK
ncbi:Uncharacterised protein r2_g2446 [Pycnogonum litorale]